MILRLGLACLALAGCLALDAGPVVRDVPPGLARRPLLSSARHPLTSRVVVRQLGYLPTGAEQNRSLVVTEYAGTASAADASAARDRRARIDPDSERSAVEPVRFGRRMGWGWSETTRIEGRLVSAAFVAVVPVGARTFAIEYTSRDPASQGPQHLRDTVGSFRAPSGRRATGIALLVSGAVLAAALGVRLRRRKR